MKDTISSKSWLQAKTMAKQIFKESVKINGTGEIKIFNFKSNFVTKLKEALIANLFYDLNMET